MLLPQAARAGSRRSLRLPLSFAVTSGRPATTLGNADRGDWNLAGAPESCACVSPRCSLILLQSAYGCVVKMMPEAEFHGKVSSLEMTANDLKH